jgi:hypothetical protein
MQHSNKDFCDSFLSTVDKNSQFNINDFISYYLNTTDTSKIDYKNYGFSKRYKRDDYNRLMVNQLIFCSKFKKQKEQEEYYEVHDNNKTDLNNINELLRFYINMYGINNTGVFTNNVNQEINFWNTILCILGIKEGYINDNSCQSTFNDYSSEYKTRCSGKMITISCKMFANDIPFTLLTSERHLNSVFNSLEAQALGLYYDESTPFLDPTPDSKFIGMLLGYPYKGRPSGNYVKLNACIKFNDKYQQYFKTSTTELTLFSFNIPDNVYTIKNSENEIVKTAIATKAFSYNKFFSNLDLGEFLFVISDV